MPVYQGQLKDHRFAKNCDTDLLWKYLEDKFADVGVR